jgi:hypothetical protein
MNYTPLTPTDDATLHWRQPGSWDRHWVLQAEERTLGSLEYTSQWKDRAIAETAAGRWTFEPEGFWKPRVIVQQGGAALFALEVTNAWVQNHAVLTTVDGTPVAIWEMTSYLRGLVEWRAQDGGPLIQYRKGADEGGIGDWVRWQCRVDFAPEGFTHAERDMLVCLGWHLNLLAITP